MKVVIELSLEHHASLLKHASENSPAFSTLQNGVKISRANNGSEDEVIVVVCDQEQADMLRHSAAHFCPNALPAIDKAVRFARFKMS
jgi:hypothetical protein